jgi:hypothetical protein
MTSPQAATVELRSYEIYRRAPRVFLTLCILLAPLLLVFWFGLCPTGANDAACPDQGSSHSVVAAFRAINPQLRQEFLVLTLVIPFVYPVSYVGLGALAVRRAPWLATLGVACGFAAGVVWATIAGQIALLDGMAQIAPYPVFVTIENHFYGAWIVLALGGFWVIGHLAGYLLLGFALWRARDPAVGCSDLHSQRSTDGSNRLWNEPGFLADPWVCADLHCQHTRRTRYDS